MPAPMCQNVLTLARIIAPAAANAANDVHRRNTLPTLPTQGLATPTLYSIYYIHNVIYALPWLPRRRVNADPERVIGVSMLIRSSCNAIQ